MIFISVFILATLLVSMWAIFIPVYKIMKKHFPLCSISSHKFSYFFVASLISTLFSPVLFYTIVLGKCGDLKLHLIRDLTENERMVK